MRSREYWQDEIRKDIEAYPKNVGILWLIAQLLRIIAVLLLDIRDRIY